MTTVVPVRMKENTLEQVDKLQKKVHAPSRSDAIRRAVEISDTLVNVAERGGRIIVEERNGKQKEILIVGLKQK